MDEAVLEKLNNGIKLSRDLKAKYAPQTIEVYEYGLKKIMRAYNKMITEKYPGRTSIKLADFFRFNTPEHIKPQNPKEFIENEKLTLKIKI